MALVVAVVAMLAVAPATSAAPKLIDRYVGGASGALGGQFNTPRDIAHNDPTVDDGNAAADGDFYVVDDANHRIQRFNADGSFDLLWGRDVVTGGSTGFEVCSVAADCKIGVVGTLGGEMDNPQGVAVDQDTGRVYVSDRDNRRIQRFDANGNFERTFGWDVLTGGVATFEICDVAANCKTGVTGAGAGQFATTFQSPRLDVSKPNANAATGSVFAADPVNRRIQEFDLDGNFVRAWGFGVDTGAAVFEVCTTASTCQGGLTTAGSDNGRFGSNQPLHVAVDAGNNVYASDLNNNSRIMRFDADDALAPDILEPELDVTTVSGTISQVTTGLEIDPTTGNLFVARSAAVGILELANPAGLATHLDTHLAGLGLNPNGIGVDPVSGDLYVSSTSTVSSTFGHRVFVADDDGTLALATVLPASDVTATTAIVSAEVNSNNAFLPTNWRLEISRNGIDWTTGSSGTLPPGDTDVPVSATATNLLPNTLYRVRVVTSKGFGNFDVISPELTFLTDAVAPELTTVYADSIDDTSARLTGRINPHSTPTRYRFEYGVENFQNVIPVPDASVGAGSSFVFVFEHASSLDPDTTYQFRLVATSESEGATTSSVETFTTGAQPDPGPRGYELVSPPDKIGGVGVGQWHDPLSSVGSMGFAAHQGERFAASGTLGSLLLDSAQGFANDWAFADRAGDVTGWLSRSPISHPDHTVPYARFMLPQAVSGDISKVAWRTNNNTAAIFPELVDWSNFLNPSLLSDWEVRWEVFGPTDLAAQLGPIPSVTEGVLCEILLSEDGSHALCGTSAGPGNLATLRGLTGPGDPTASTWPDLVAGRSIYIADTSTPLADSFDGAGDRTLVNVCTDGTEIPSVDGSGDIQAQPCPPALAGRDDRLISDHGAAIQVGIPAAQPRTSVSNVLSKDGSRVFFMSPDPLAVSPGNGTAPCSGSGAATLCPPQLYVRQLNEDDTVTTRWISKAEDGLFGTQDAALVGQARFEGATPNGDKVFFRTSSPLTADDPNGACGAPCTTGTPDSSSWDLYMYDLPDGPDGDPDTPDGDPAGGVLTRISAGPTGSGDCNGLQALQAPGDFDQGILRSTSADGSVVYFVCAAPLPDAADGPVGGVTAPSGTQSTVGTTNLYIFDASRPLADRWRFVALIPRSTAGNSIDSCASTGTTRGNMLSAGAALHGSVRNCVQGTADGQFLTFWTMGRLTADDPDANSADIYGYDATSHELLRVSATQSGVGSTYPCGLAPTPLCNADFGNEYRDAYGRTPAPHLGVAVDPLTSGDRVVFFQSLSRLVPTDTDESYDVYQWRNGTLSLLTTGSTQAFLKGSDRTGRNVYFATDARLTWRDIDAVTDVYTARVGGGIPEPPPSPVCAVLLNQCQTGGASPVPVPPNTTSSTGGGGNADPGARKRVTLGKLPLAQRRKAARSGVIRLRIRSNRAGVVRLLARGRIGRRMRRVGRASKRLSKPGVARVNLRLNSRARRALKAGRKLNLSIQVRSPGARSRSMTVRLPGAKS